MVTHAALERRIKHWQKVLAPLGVAHWRLEEVKIMDEVPTSPTATASVRTSGYYDSCWMAFKRDELPAKINSELDETIVHEWLHVALRDMDDALATVCTWMPDATWNDWNERVDHEREGVIERLSRLIVALHSAGS